MSSSFLTGRLGEARSQAWGEGPELKLKSYSRKAGLYNADGSRCCSWKEPWLLLLRPRRLGDKAAWGW